MDVIRKHRMLKPRAFCIISVCMALSVPAAILAIREFTERDTPWRTIATFGASALVLFNGEWRGEGK